MSDSDWFANLASMEYLGLSTNTMVGGRPLSRYKSGLCLVEPKTVYQFPEAVVRKGDEKLLWDVLTRTEDGENFELVGKEWSTIKPYKFKGTKDEIAENFMVMKGSSEYVTKMLKDRMKRVKGSHI